MNHRIVCLGNAVIDMSFGGTQFPIVPNEHQMLDSRLITPGGMANTAICAARLGLAVTCLGNIGDDNLADLWRGPLRREGISVEGMLVLPEQPTTLSLVLSEVSGSHVFVGHRADMLLPPGGFPAQWEVMISTADALCIDGWNYLSIGPDVNLRAIEIAKKANIPIFYDPGPWIAQMDADWRDAMFAQCSVILLTQEEAEIAVGEGLAPEDLAEAIRQQGAKLVVLKRGGIGMLGRTETETAFQPGLEVPVRDLTGAGDSVQAAIMLGYLEQYDLPKMLAIANATGAACVQKFGAGVNVPYKDEVLAELGKMNGRYHF
ncbi:MAG: carbohydrate kinase family protein [Anaerolineales bacterium]|nr:carbohydrate kinase family protein [Anaerolineales bacterium]